jgi:hypothetical protein
MAPEDIYRLMMSLFVGFEPIARTEVGTITVSTILANDLEVYETALVDKVRSHPVERYDTEEEALQGHMRWVEKVPSLECVTRLGYGSLVEDEEIKLEK